MSRYGIFIAGLTAALGIVIAAPVLGQQPKYQSASACRFCHQQTPQAIEGNSLLKDALPFVLFNEGQLWQDRDLHAQAYKILTSDRSKKIGELLKIADVSRDRQCLACHATHSDPADAQVAVNNNLSVLLQEGVGCEACHGPSSQWDQPHRFREWRAKPAAEKTALGMVDVRDPIARTRQCLSCHLGNAEQGKVITHEMYAAGHPPLPSFEIESFADNMPRHWRYSTEKTGLSADERKELQADADPFPRTRRVVVGGLVALAESMKLLADRAEKLDQSGHWPALAEFDCGACHHDLRNDSWRQRRGYAAAPGRPLVRHWPESLIDLGLPGSEELPARLAPLQQAISSQPFGDPKATAKAAREIAAWADQRAAEVSRQPLDSKRVNELVAALARRGQQSWVDYDAARQIAWALVIVDRDRADAQSRQAIAEKLSELDKLLNLRAASQRPAAGDESPLIGLLPQMLECRANFDPQKTHALYREIEVGVK